MKRVQIDKILKILEKHTPDYNAPVAELVKSRTKDVFRILVATILSARTNDKTTAKVCNELFKKVKTLNDLEKISLKELQKIIKPINYYKNKSKYLKQLPKAIKEEFNGKIPNTIEELTKLPGAGRKTANIVVASAFGKPAIGVDTHVHKIMNRIGYVKTKTPNQTEQELRKKLPKKYWRKINIVWVSFGQRICKSIPVCSKCPIEQYCYKFGVKKSK